MTRLRHAATNDETRINHERPNDETMSILQFVLRALSFLWHWSFVIRHLGFIHGFLISLAAFPAILLYYRDLDFSLDISRMKFPEDFFEKMRPKVEEALVAMRELETGAIVNPTEKRMVGHYWLRNPALAPTVKIGKKIEDTLNRIKRLSEDQFSLEQ